MMSRKEKRVFFNSNLCKIQRRGPCITGKPLPPIKPASIDNYFAAPRVEPFYHFLMEIVSGTPGAIEMIYPFLARHKIQKKKTKRQIAFI